MSDPYNISVAGSYGNFTHALPGAHLLAAVPGVQLVPAWACAGALGVVTGGAGALAVAGVAAGVATARQAESCKDPRRKFAGQDVAEVGDVCCTAEQFTATGCAGGCIGGATAAAAATGVGVGAAVAIGGGVAACGQLALMGPTMCERPVPEPMFWENREREKGQGEEEASEELPQDDGLRSACCGGGAIEIDSEAAPHASPAATALSQEPESPMSSAVSLAQSRGGAPR